MQRQQSLLRNRHVRRLLLSAATGAILVGTAAGPVFAGPQHNNTDPARTGCNSNARLIATRPIETEFGQVVSYVDVYYSLSCTTNWIRVRNNPAGGLAVKYLWASNGNTTTAQSDYGSGSTTATRSTRRAPRASRSRLNSNTQTDGTTPRPTSRGRTPSRSAEVDPGPAHKCPATRQAPCPVICTTGKAPALRVSP